MKVAIVGLGLIGGSIALELKKASWVSEVIGVDQSPDHAKLATELKLVHKVLPLDEAIKEAELIVLATPVDSIVKLLPIVLDQMSGTKTVTDVGSTKMEIGVKVQNHPNRKHFVAAHPMAGTEHSGPKAAHLGLFQGKAAVICDAPLSSPESVKLVEKLFTTLGMRLVSMDGAAHDLHTAYVSHLSHITSFVLASTVLDKEKDVEAIFNLASGGFESTVRLAKSSPAMWAPIFEQNQVMIAGALRDYIERLQAFHDSLIKRDFEQTKKYMERANEIKRVLVEMGQQKEKA